MKSFEKGDWVYINSPISALHGEHLQIVEIQFDPFSGRKEFGVELGAAKVYLFEDRLSWEHPGYPGHSGHEVIENFAGGKSFKFCRQCRTEVL